MEYSNEVLRRVPNNLVSGMRSKEEVAKDLSDRKCTFHVTNCNLNCKEYSARCFFDFDRSVNDTCEKIYVVIYRSGVIFRRNGNLFLTRDFQLSADALKYHLEREESSPLSRVILKLYSDSATQ